MIETSNRSIAKPSRTIDWFGSIDSLDSFDRGGKRASATRGEKKRGRIRNQKGGKKTPVCRFWKRNRPVSRWNGFSKWSSLITDGARNYHVLCWWEPGSTRTKRTEALEWAGESIPFLPLVKLHEWKSVCLPYVEHCPRSPLLQEVAKICLKWDFKESSYYSFDVWSPVLILK